MSWRDDTAQPVQGDVDPLGTAVTLASNERRRVANANRRDLTHPGLNELEGLPWEPL
jgi:hypothetical protein